VARRTYKLDHATKGTGASVVPIEDQPKPASGDERLRTVAIPRERHTKPADAGPIFTTPLPPGHVRKKATGELGKVQAVDPSAGTIEVLWLRDGRTSTVPLASVTRR
jgi:hypothetical protein